MRLALVATVAAVAAWGCAARAHFAPADGAAIRRVLDAQVAAWNRGDLDAYMDGYARTDDLVFTSGGNVRLGWQVAFDHYRKRYAEDRAAMGTLRFEITRVDPVGADAAVVLGTWVLTGSPADGRGVFSLVLARRPEGWRVIHDHTSVAPPAP
ncbi:MAG: nuclear transport factor 2 family protein [Deltaproteobacteria bacterium]|nr:nuclear transport factor 2 family protein [Deltaproteobacteria bacterium]MCW5802600.1 nuclear transport factor 2 family protein [Deltaproteobacteria bacterium]